MLFSDFWIINENGIALFFMSNGVKTLSSMEMDLMSGLFSAIQTLAVTNIHENLQTITFDKTKMIFVKVDDYPDLFFVGRVKKEAKNNIAIRELKKMGTMFISEYKEILNNWGGDTDVFTSFEELIIDC